MNFNLSDEEVSHESGTSTGTGGSRSVRRGGGRDQDRPPGSIRTFFTQLSARGGLGTEISASSEKTGESSRRSSMEKQDSLRLADVTPADRNALQNSSRLFSPDADAPSATAKDAKAAADSLSNFEASTSAEADGTFQAKNLFFATAEGARAVRSSVRVGVGSTTSCSSFSNNDRKSKKRKGVTFHPSIRCRPHISISQFSPDEFRATWRSESDKFASQQEILATARKMKESYAAWFARDKSAGQLAQFLPLEEQPWYISTEQETSRGIEHMVSKTHTRARRDQKKHIVEAVLYEQFVQRQSGMNDSGGIAMTSNGISEHCRQWADQKAKGDAIHGEKRRESLLNKYAGAAKRMSKLDAQLLAGLEKLAEEDGESDEEEEGRGSERKLRGGDDDGDSGGGSRGTQGHRRSSAISFEKHDALIAEELNSLVDDEDEKDGEITRDPRANQVDKEQRRTSVISKFELCTLDEQIASGRIQMHQNACVDTSIGQTNSDFIEINLSSSISTDSSAVPRERRTSFQFLHTSAGANAAAARATALAAACLEESDEE